METKPTPAQDKTARKARAMLKLLSGGAKRSTPFRDRVSYTANSNVIEINRRDHSIENPRINKEPSPKSKQNADGSNIISYSDHYFGA